MGTQQSRAMPVKVEKIVDPVSLGEGPHWDEEQQALFFVSIVEKTIHKYVLSTKKHTKTTLDGRIGFIIPVDGTKDQFLVGLERKFVIVSWDGEENSKATIVKELAEVDQGTKNRINDGKADPKGRLFAGTMGPEEPLGNFLSKDAGTLFRVTPSSVTPLESRIGISNGLAWDVKRKAFYYTDSLERKVRRYDYDVDSGEISNMKYFIDFDKIKQEGLPDGSTIDAEGNLWIAVFNGSAILKISPNAEVLQKIDIPAKQVTSVTFGGPNYDILFVTTACLNIDEEQKPPSGSVFMVTGLGVKGLKNVSFKL